MCICYWKFRQIFGAAHGGGKHGRGTDKTAVGFALSFDKAGRCAFMKASVLSGVTSAEITRFAAEAIKKGSHIRSDGLHAYCRISEDYAIHQQVFNHKNTQSTSSGCTLSFPMRKHLCRALTTGWIAGICSCISMSSAFVSVEDIGNPNSSTTYSLLLLILPLLLVML